MMRHLLTAAVIAVLGFVGFAVVMRDRIDADLAAAPKPELCSAGKDLMAKAGASYETAARYGCDREAAAAGLRALDEKRYGTR